MLILPSTLLHGGRSLASASSQYLWSNRTGVSITPFTVGGWFKPTTLAANHILFCIANSGSSADVYELYYDNPNSTLRMLSGQASGTIAQSGSAADGTAMTAGVWQHVLGRSKGTADRSAALNGAFGTVNATVITPTQSNINATYIGVQRYNGALSSFANGAKFGWGLWNVDLTDQEVALLAKGYSPLMVRPNNLVSYWPFGADLPTRDWVGPAHLINVGTTPSLDRPSKFILPATQRRIYFDAVVGGATSGALAGTLGALTSSATGSLSITGSLAQTLGAVTSSATGSLSITGALSQTLGAATLTAAGSGTVTGTLAQTLGAATLAATGSLSINGSLAQTLGAVTLAGTGASSPTGQLTATLADASLASTGSLSITGTLAQSLAAASVVAAGTIQIRGALAQTLGAATLSAAGFSGSQSPIAGTLAVTLANVTVAAEALLYTAGPRSGGSHAPRTQGATSRPRQANTRRP